ncbi:MAG: hypothetical protein FVQ77_04690 [Cytophagales bacterium]|nr:hypothetical protein [Cytophagales bacterium]
MNKSDFYKLLHRRLAQNAIGASTIRNQGDKGLIKICRDYLEHKIDLTEFFNSLSDSTEYRKFLNRHTNAIVKLFPKTAKSWGAARKGLNLFLRDLTYNKYFADKFNLPTDFHLNNNKLKNLEVPLDNYVAKELCKYFKGQLSKWKGIKHLKLPENDKYQIKAKELAKEKDIARVHLDLEFWRNRNQKQKNKITKI